MQRLILTRLLEDNKNIVKLIENQSFSKCTCFDIVQFRSRIIESPLLNIKSVAFNIDFAASSIAKSDAVVLSSRHASYALKGICSSDKLFYVVGEATARELKVAGFENIGYIARNMADMILFLKDAHKLPINFCYLRGIHIAFDFADWSKVNSFFCHEVQVYDSVPAIEFSRVLSDFMLGDEHASAVFFSRRAAQSFIDITAADGFMHRINAIKALCISASVLESVEHVFENRAYVASSPDLRGMAELVLEHFKDG